MTPLILLWPAARKDLLAQAEWLEERTPGAGTRFLGAATAAMGRLASTPRMGRAPPEASPLFTGLRSWPVRGFAAILLFYRPIRGGIEVLRVLHGARDLPGELDAPTRPAEEG